MKCGSVFQCYLEQANAMVVVLLRENLKGLEFLIIGQTKCFLATFTLEQAFDSPQPWCYTRWKNVFDNVN